MYTSGVMYCGSSEAYPRPGFGSRRESSLIASTTSSSDTCRSLAIAWYFFVSTFLRCPAMTAGKRSASGSSFPSPSVRNQRACTRRHSRRSRAPQPIGSNRWMMCSTFSAHAAEVPDSRAMDISGSGSPRAARAAAAALVAAFSAFSAAARASSPNGSARTAGTTTSSPKSGTVGSASGSITRYPSRFRLPMIRTPIRSSSRESPAMRSCSIKCSVSPSARVSVSW